nr:chromate transporter [Ectobacillus ponti]
MFFSFFRIGLLSFGGGYAMIPVVQHEVLTNGWMSKAQFAEAVALAGMAPGPIATNIAIYVGYRTAGWVGGLTAMLGMILPSLLIIWLIGTVFYKVYQKDWVKAAFYGLKPAVAALIFFAAIRLAMANPMFTGVTRQGVSVDTLLTYLMFGLAFLAIARFKLHPLSVILLSGLVGIAVYL